MVTLIICNVHYCSVGSHTVPDLMNDYTQILNGQPRTQAWRSLQQERANRGDHPYHWASFILSGDGTPLSPQ